MEAETDVEAETETEAETGVTEQNANVVFNVVEDTADAYAEYLFTNDKDEASADETIPERGRKQQY